MVSRMSESRAAPTHGGYSRWFVIVVAVFVTCLITANVTAVKLVDLFGFILPAGVVFFPVSYIAGDAGVLLLSAGRTIACAVLSNVW
jgi:uncharacterized PurR-regulated membrane protein YhhQ (DUF165 family)